MRKLANLKRCYYFTQFLYNFYSQSMSHRHALSLQELYSTANNLYDTGVEGYRIHRNYFDSAKEAELREQAKKKKGVKDRRHVTKKGSYLDQEQKLHKSVPGPGQYPVTDQWPVKPKLKIRYLEKKTYVDEIVKFQKKWKQPAPGQYNITKSLKEFQAEKKQLAVKKLHFQDRITFLDDLHFRSTQMPGAGNYNPRDRIKTEYSKLKTKPEFWRKKHEDQSKKKPAKSPEVGGYSPMPADFTLFEHLSKTKKSKNQLGKVQRFKTTPTGSGIPPAKYSVLQQWRGKDNKKLQRHGFQALSKTSYKSVYYH